MHASLIKVPCVFSRFEKDEHLMTKDSPLLNKCRTEVVFIFGFKQASPLKKNMNLLFLRSLAPPLTFGFR